MATIDDFKAGVTASLRSWSAFRTAVDSGWGGSTNQSLVKAENLRNSILSIMTGEKFPIPHFDVFELADNLAIYMEEEFSVTLEDKSEEQIAATIFRIYEDCYNGDPTFARQLVAQAEAAIATTSQFPTQVQTTEHDDEDDEDDDMVDSETGHVVVPVAVNQGINIAEYAAAPLFGAPTGPKPAPTGPVRQLGDSVPEESVIEVDDDGFAPVKPKGKKR